MKIYLQSYIQYLIHHRGQMEPNQNNGSDFFDTIFTYFDEYGIDNEIKFNQEPETSDKNFSIQDLYDFDFNLFGENLTDNELTFNGDVELAKEYSEKEKEEIIKTNDLSGCHDKILKDFESHNEYKSDMLSTSSTASVNRMSKLDVSGPIILQNPKESRLNYLLRFPKLYQEFMNSSNLEKLKALLYDVLAEECIFHILTSPPMMGVHKIYEMQCLTLKNAPDFYTLIYHIKYVKKRIITLRGKSFGTLPHTNNNNSSSSTSKLQPTENNKQTFWNFMGISLEKLDEFHRLQKQKYDTLVSQNKIIKFERSTKWYVFLNKELTKVEKVMAHETHLEIFEK